MTNTTNEALQNPHITQAFRTPKLLVSGYVAISWGAIVALFLMRNHHNLATQEAWVHGFIISGTALLMASFMWRAARGDQNSFLRLRITTAILLAAIIVTSAIPGDFPMWMKLEQGVCAILLLGVVVLINGKQLRSVFASK